MEKKEYDIIFLGKGLKEYILLSLLFKYPRIKKESLNPEDLKICQIISSKYKDESFFSLNISQLFQKFNKNYIPEKYGDNKDWNIDFIPKIMLRNSPLIKIFLITEIYSYIEWKTIDQVYVYQYDQGGMFSSPKGILYKIPQNQDEIWNCDILGIFEKNRCKKFYNYITDLIFSKNNEIKNTENIDINNISFKTFSNNFNLDENTLDFIGHCIALYSDDNFLNNKAIDTITRIKFYMENLTIPNNKNNNNGNNKLYYTTPFIFPIWGLQKIYKNYEREMYLYDYKSIDLDKDNDNFNDIEEIIFDENHKFKGIKTSKGERIYGKILISSPEYMLKFTDIKAQKKILRRTIVINNQFLPQNLQGDSCQIIVPKKQTGLKNDIFILKLSYGHCICRKGYSVFFISCWDDGREIDMQLKSVMDALEINKNMADIFDMRDDYYEPNDLNFENNIFISNSFLPQSHFEDDFDDIINLFGKITDAKLQFDKLKNSN